MIGLFAAMASMGGALFIGGIIGIIVCLNK